MDKTWKDIWVTALESGAYKQTGGIMSRNSGTFDETSHNSFCCLGVLRHVATGLTNQEIRSKTPVADSAKDETYKYDYGGQLKIAELDYFGIKQDEMYKLIKMNDDKQKSFRQIANWIKENM